MVRVFPRATRRTPSRRRARAATAVVLGLLLSGSGAGVALAGDLDDQQSEVEREIEEQTDHVEESSAELTAATRALLRAEAELDAARGILAQARAEVAAAEVLDQQMQQRLLEAQARLERARAELVGGRREIREQERRLRQVVVSAYEQADPAVLGLSMVFSTQDPAELAGNMNATSTVTNLEASILDRLEASSVLLELRRGETRAARIEVAERRAEAAENLAVKEASQQRAAEAEAQIVDLVTRRAEARKDARAAKRADLAELARLNAERDRIERLIKAAAARASAYPGAVDGNGVLLRPVDGAITSPYGWRTHPIWGYRSLHDGIDFGVACGTPIRAAAGGKVIAEYYQTAWGNRIVVDHGTRNGVRVATISNHLESYAVASGDVVTRGQVIGYVGSTGWSTGCHLHWTVLENGRAVDPMPWL